MTAATPTGSMMTSFRPLGDDALQASKIHLEFQIDMMEVEDATVGWLMPMFNHGLIPGVFSTQASARVHPKDRHIARPTIGRRLVLMRLLRQLADSIEESLPDYLRGDT